MMRVSTCVIFKPVLIASTASVQEPLALARRCVEEIPCHGILDSTFERCSGKSCLCRWSNHFLHLEFERRKGTFMVENSLSKKYLVS